MKELNILVKDVERDLVVGIIISVKYKKISFDESKILAQEFLAKPYKNYEELFQKLFELSKKYREVRRVYVKYAPEFEYFKADEMLRIMRNYMKLNDFESAVKIAKG